MKYKPRYSPAQQIEICKKLLAAREIHGTLHKAAKACNVPIWTAYRVRHWPLWTCLEREHTIALMRAQGAFQATPAQSAADKLDALLGVDSEPEPEHEHERAIDPLLF